MLHIHIFGGGELAPHEQPGFFYTDGCLFPTAVHTLVRENPGCEADRQVFQGHVGMSLGSGLRPVSRLTIIQSPH